MRLIRGAPGSGKTTLVLREFKEALRNAPRHKQPDLRIVVPTATLVRHLQHELARDGAVFSPDCVVSLHRFIGQRAPEGIENIVPPDSLLRAFVRDALLRLNLPAFARVSTTEGMTTVAVETIALFENAGCTPERLATVRGLEPPARAFAKLWQAVAENVRNAGFESRTTRLRAAAQNPRPLLIWMDGFLSFSPLEAELVRALAKTCDLTITITDSPAADEIRKLALQLGAEDRLLQGKPRKPRASVVEAATPEREVDEIARRVIALREGGMPFRSIGVALRDAPAYASLLRTAFGRFGVPARFYFPQPLRTHPVAIFLGGLMSGPATGWDFETSLEALRANPRWGRSADFDRFEYKVREAMPGRGVEALLQLCERDWLREQIAQCLATEAWKTDQLLPSEWRARCERLAAGLYRPASLQPPRDHHETAVAQTHVAALRAWITAVGNATAFWQNSEAPVSLETFWKAAAAAIDHAVFEVPDSRADVVPVMSVYEARQWDMEALFVCGMTDRDFPKRQPQNLLFPDSEIETLHKVGIPLRKADQPREEEWLFAFLKARARASLILTWPRRDTAGKSIERSRFLDELVKEGGIAQAKAPLCRPLQRVALESHGLQGRIQAGQLLNGMAGLHRTISLTALEDLAQCRFKFFGGRTLALKGPPERPGERLQARITGTILHKALEKWQVAQHRDFVELFEEAFDEACRTEHLPAGYRLEVERIQAREIARRVSANEKWNKPESAQVEVELNLAFPGGVTVRCRIDRIDRFPAGCVIVDYKSGKTTNVKNLVESGTRLQGPLYALAARETLRLKPLAMVYWAVREDEVHGWGEIPGYAGKGLLEMEPGWADAARDRTVARLESFLGGDVKARPENSEECRWCDFATACRVEEQETLVTIGGALGA